MTHTTRILTCNSVSEVSSELESTWTSVVVGSSFVVELSSWLDD